MSFLEIILIGYLVNLSCSLIIFLLSMISQLFIILSDNKVDSAKILMKQSQIISKFQSIKNQAKSKEVSVLFQEDLAFLIPFATIIDFIKAFYHFLRLDLIQYSFSKLEERIEDIEKRISEK